MRQIWQFYRDRRPEPTATWSDRSGAGARAGPTDALWIHAQARHSIERAVALTRQAEAAGFAYGWLFDSHVLWLEPYPLLTLMAQATKRMRLGTCVTNPAMREPSVTASALATSSCSPAAAWTSASGAAIPPAGSWARRPPHWPLEEAIHVICALAEGRPVEYEGAVPSSPGRAGHRLPAWIAGYGPVALKLTGRIADGVILQFADPHL